MRRPYELSYRRIDRINRQIASWLLFSSTHVMPIALGVVSLLALIAWQTQYPYDAPQHLPIRAVADDNASLSPAQALALLLRGSTGSFHDTELSEAPVWTVFTVPEDSLAWPMPIEFPSRHAMDIACWNASTLTALGRGNRQGTTGSIFAVKAGFALEVTSSAAGSNVLCPDPGSRAGPPFSLDLAAR